MEAAEDFFAAPAFGTFPGAASRGRREEPGERAAASPAAVLDVVPAFAPHRRLRLGGEREETTSTQEQICRISCIRKAFGPSLPD